MGYVRYWPARFLTDVAKAVSFKENWQDIAPNYRNDWLGPSECLTSLCFWLGEEGDVP